jgi:XTP/dITP diphosphohydrolase
MQLVFASTNPNKTSEIRELLGPIGVRVLSLADVGCELAAPSEDGVTFADNARSKALAYAHALGDVCLADDSGLVVEALRGAPGVHSARYAGTCGNREEQDRRNRDKLLSELRGVPEAERDARLVCSVCLANGAGEVLFEASGFVRGLMIDSPRGTRGFGYDTHLYLPELGKTVAELTLLERNLLTHRAIAVRQLAGWLLSSWNTHNAWGLR